MKPDSLAPKINNWDSKWWPWIIKISLIMFCSLSLRSQRSVKSILEKSPLCKLVQKKKIKDWLWNSSNWKNPSVGHTSFPYRTPIANMCAALIEIYLVVQLDLSSLTPSRPSNICQKPIMINSMGPFKSMAIRQNFRDFLAVTKAPFLSKGCTTHGGALETRNMELLRDLLLKVAMGYGLCWASLVAQTVKNLPAIQETQVQSLGWEDSLEKGMATHSSILAWRIPWTEEPGGLWSMEL